MVKFTITSDHLDELPKELTNHSLVLVGGCFDILHPGHLAFLEKAKKLGELLIVLLESDQAVTKRKGKGRPINSSDTRSRELLTKTPVNGVIILGFPFTDDDYDSLVSSLKPAIIATTKGDPYIAHKIRQGKIIGAKVIEVIDRITSHSTTSIINKSL